jgi:selenocysteine lyase/cysteine desulfurase
VRTLRLWPASGDRGRIGVVTFTVDGWPAQHVAQYLSAEHGIGVRDGRFCAHPLLARLTPASVVPDGAAVRASLGLGSRAADVDRLVDALGALRAHGPSWAYADAAGGIAPRTDPRALPHWLAGGPAGRPSPCAG